MITRILVPTDFSSAADNALRFALELAKKAGAQVHLLHANFVPVGDAYFTASAFDDIMDSMEASAQEGFERLKNAYYKDVHMEFISSTAYGLIPDEVLDYTTEHNIDLIVMGTTGDSNIPHLLMGSNTAAVIQRSGVPVMAVPPDTKYADFKQIVYATDLYGQEFPAVSRLIYLADMFGAQVHVLNVQTEKDSFSLTDKDSFFIRNRENLSLKKWKLHTVKGDNVLEGMEKFMTEIKADLVVLSKHKRPFFERIFHRSLSKRMLYHTSIPLLVLGQDK